MAPLPPGIRLIISFSRDQWYRAFIFILTFLLYASFHLSRKPISIVKGELHRYCATLYEGQVGFSSWSRKASDTPRRQPADNETDCSWAPFDQDNYQQLLGALDYSFLCAYAIGMYLSGIIGERLPIRYYLTFGMLASGAFTALFGLGYFYNIHSFGFYVVTQIINGLVQTTGWPSVVTCLGNWFGKGRRGLIMGVWNSHTSVGNILGSLIAGYWVSTCWGLSFVVPGAIVAAMGIVCFLFLIEHPKDIACSSSLAAPKGYENGTHRFRLQKQVFTDDKSQPLDPEMQCLLLSDGKHPVHQNHVVVLPADGGGSMAAISFTGALRIPGVIEFSLCLLFAKLVSYTFLFWLPLYITNVDHLDARQAGELSTLFDVGGIFGGILAGVISDRLEKRASTCGLMLLLAAPTLYVFSTISKMGLEATVGHAQKSQGKLPRPRHCDRHHRRDWLCRSGPGPPAGRASVPVWVEQRFLHAHVRRRLCLTVPDPPHSQGAELPGVGDRGPGSVQGTLTPRVPWREAGPVLHKLPVKEKFK
ncbi:glucose-6-phosphate exchanger SLC37A1 isoform X4 [Ailuropoda melanoleuca]|uniref:Solute carrier family 37 member 1 n=1 Tax=Ailuropoda melanoleuca TaxID=9646 RepID=G1L574_AILME|nr:glucose-6-phosphate exchanger SLC37A1 isoform X4 [Ailuropoda melanoleuca]